MTTQHDPGPRLSEHLSREARGRAPDWLLESTLAIIETTPQRRALPHLPWRFPNMNTFAKLAIAAVVVIVGAVAVTRFSGAGLNVVGGPGSTASPSQLLSPSPSSSSPPSPTPAASPSSTPTTIGSLTLTDNGCQWAADTSALPSGLIGIDVSNTAQDYGAFVLLVVAPGKTFADLTAVLNDFNTQAQQNPVGVQIDVPADIATHAGLLPVLAPGATGSIAANIPPGSVAGIACARGDPSANKVYSVYTVGPLKFTSPATIGSVTLTATGCEWSGDPIPLSAGSIAIDASNTSQDDGMFLLLVVEPGHTFAEVKNVLDGYNTQAQQNPVGVQVDVPTDIASHPGFIPLLTPGATGSLEANIPAGSVAAIACGRGNAAADSDATTRAIRQAAQRAATRWRHCSRVRTTVCEASPRSPRAV